MDKGLDLASERMGRLFQMKDSMCEKSETNANHV